MPLTPGLLVRYWDRDAGLLLPTWPGTALALAEHLRATVVLLASQAAALAMGMRVAAWALGPTRLPDLRRILVALGLGHGFLGLLTLGLGLAGLVMPGLLRVAVIAALWAGGPPRRWVPRTAGRPADPAEPRRLLRLATVAAVLLAGSNLTAAFLPEWFYDSLVYHLALPEQYLLAHKIAPVDHTFISNYPLLQEMRYLFCLGLGDGVAAKLLHWSDGICCAAAAWSLARPVAGRAGGWLAAALFLSTPTLLLLQQSTMVELGLAWFATLAVLTILEATDPDRRRAGHAGLVLVTGAFLGMAHGVKYVGLNASLLVVAGLGFVLRRRRVPLPRAAGRLAACIACASLWTAPWLAKNWGMTGNPVYPFFSGWIPSLHWDPGRQALWMADNLKYGIARGSLAGWLSLPGRLMTDASDFGSLGLNPFPLVFLPPLLLLRGVPREIRAVGGFAAAFFLLWAVSTQQARFLLPALPAAAAAAAYAVIRLASLGWLQRGIVLAAAGWILLASGYESLMNRFVAAPLLPILTGHQSRSEVLERNIGYYGAVRRAYEVVGPRDRILFIGSDESYYCARARICDSLYDHSTLGRLAGLAASPADLAHHLRRRLRITHLLVSIPRCEEYIEYGLFAFNDRARANVLGLWHAHLHPVYNARGQGLFEVTLRPVAPGERKTGTPSWLLSAATVRAVRTSRQATENLAGAGNQGGALAVTDAWVRAAPDSEEPWVHRQSFLGRLGRLAEADRAGATALRLGYPPGSFYQDRGVLRARRADWAGAASAFRTAAALDPSLTAQSLADAQAAEAALPHRSSP